MALVLAVMMVLGVATAWADNSVTVTVPSDDSDIGSNTYTAYQIFTGTQVYVEDEHYLVDSRKTSGRKRGQTRDANNKGHHFPEMEIINEEQFKNEIRQEALQEVQANRIQMMHCENMMRQQKDCKKRVFCAFFGRFSHIWLEYCGILAIFMCCG